MQADISHPTKRNFLSSLLSFFSKPETHVRISEKGRALLNNKQLASKVVDAIIHSKQELEKGEDIKIAGENFSIKLVTTLHEENESAK